MNIMEAAEHHCDRLWDEQCDNEALLEYLDERGITLAQYEAECKQAQEDAAADKAFWRDHE